MSFLSCEGLRLSFTSYVVFVVLFSGSGFYNLNPPFSDVRLYLEWRLMLEVKRHCFKLSLICGLFSYEAFFYVHQWLYVLCLFKA